MESEGVSLPLIHEHLMIPWNDTRRGDCCGHLDSISDGYYCKSCDFFVHKNCGDEVSESIEHPSHPEHTLRLRSRPNNWCDLCFRDIVNLSYHCEICLFDIDLYCAKYSPPEVLDISGTYHRHKLTLLKEWIEFACAKCGNIGKEGHYKCNECDLTFHVDCVWHPSDKKQPLVVKHPLERSQNALVFHLEKIQLVIVKYIGSKDDQDWVLTVKYKLKHHYRTYIWSGILFLHRRKHFSTNSYFSTEGTTFQRIIRVVLHDSNCWVERERERTN